MFTEIHRVLLVAVVDHQHYPDGKISNNLIQAGSSLTSPLDVERMSLWPR
jgi:hypothetical protein